MAIVVRYDEEDEEWSQVYDIKRTAHPDEYMFVTGGGGPEYAWKVTCSLEGDEYERNPEIVCINRHLVLSGHLLSTDDKTFFIEDFDVGSYMRDWGTTWSRHGALPDGAAGIGIYWDARHEALFGKIIVPEADTEPTLPGDERLNALRLQVTEITDKIAEQVDAETVLVLALMKEKLNEEIAYLEAVKDGRPVGEAHGVPIPERYADTGADSLFGRTWLDELVTVHFLLPVLIPFNGDAIDLVVRAGDTIGQIKKQLDRELNTKYSPLGWGLDIRISRNSYEWDDEISIGILKETLSERFEVDIEWKYPEPQSP